MDIKERTKEELEKRIQNLEKLIAKKGVGSSYLNRIQKTQRNVNLMLFAGGLLTIVGLLSWLAMSSSTDEDSE